MQRAGSLQFPCWHWCEAGGEGAVRLGQPPGAQKSQRGVIFSREEASLLAFGMRDDGKEVRESQPWSPPPNGRKNPCQTPPRSLSNGVWTQASCQMCQHRRGQVLTVSQTRRARWELRGVRVRLRESRPEGARGWKNNDIPGQISGLMKTWSLWGVEEGL